MSHFTVMVIGDDVEKQLAGFHEFECTGDDNEYVKDVDITDEVRVEMAKAPSDNQPLDYALEYFGLPVVDDEAKLDKSDTHKDRYAIVRDGELVKAVQRTNADKKWDWWQVGGRWTGFLKLKPGREGVTGEPGLMTPLTFNFSAAEARTLAGNGMVMIGGYEPP
jgi:hypothetical protein